MPSYRMKDLPSEEIASNSKLLPRDAEEISNKETYLRTYIIPKLSNVKGPVDYTERLPFVTASRLANLQSGNFTVEMDFTMDHQDFCDQFHRNNPGAPAEAVVEGFQIALDSSAVLLLKPFASAKQLYSLILPEKAKAKVDELMKVCHLPEVQQFLAKVAARTPTINVNGMALNGMALTIRSAKRKAVALSETADKKVTSDSVAKKKTREERKEERKARRAETKRERKAIAAKEREEEDERVRQTVKEILRELNEPSIPEAVRIRQENRAKEIEEKGAQFYEDALRDLWFPFNCAMEAYDHGNYFEEEVIEWDIVPFDQLGPMGRKERDLERLRDEYIEELKRAYAAEDAEAMDLTE